MLPCSSLFFPVWLRARTPLPLLSVMVVVSCCSHVAYILHSYITSVNLWTLITNTSHACANSVCQASFSSPTQPEYEASVAWYMGSSENRPWYIIHSCGCCATIQWLKRLLALPFLQPSHFNVYPNALHLWLTSVCVQYTSIVFWAICFSYSRLSTSLS